MKRETLPTPWRVQHTPKKGRAGPRLEIVDANGEHVLDLGGYWNEALGERICAGMNSALRRIPAAALKRTKGERR